MGSWSRSLNQAELESACGATACQLCVLGPSLLVFMVGTQLYLSMAVGGGEVRGSDPDLVGQYRKRV